MHSPRNEAWKAAAAKGLQDRHSIATTAIPERERTRSDEPLQAKPLAWQANGH